MGDFSVLVTLYQALGFSTWPGSELSQSNTPVRTACSVHRRGWRGAHLQRAILRHRHRHQRPVAAEGHRTPHRGAVVAAGADGVHFAFYILLCTFHILHFTFCILHCLDNKHIQKLGRGPMVVSLDWYNSPQQRCFRIFYRSTTHGVLWPHWIRSYRQRRTMRGKFNENILVPSATSVLLAAKPKLILLVCWRATCSQLVCFWGFDRFVQKLRSAWRIQKVAFFF